MYESTRSQLLSSEKLGASNLRSHIERCIFHDFFGFAVHSANSKRRKRHDLDAKSLGFLNDLSVHAMNDGHVLL